MIGFIGGVAGALTIYGVRAIAVRIQEARYYRNQVAIMERAGKAYQAMIRAMVAR